MQVKTNYQTLKGKCTLDPPPAVVDRTEDGRKSSSQPQLNVQRASSVTHTFNFFCSACTFCGATGSEFAEEAQLNRHYLQYCAMLYQCPHCTQVNLQHKSSVALPLESCPCLPSMQVVEIAALNEHWLTECSGKGKFRKCPRCREAVLATQYPMHITAKTCRGECRTYYLYPMYKLICPHPHPHTT